MVAMAMMPNISGINRRAMIRLPPRRMPWDATSAPRFHAPANIARLRRLNGGDTSAGGITTTPESMTRKGTIVAVSHTTGIWQAHRFYTTEEAVLARRCPEERFPTALTNAASNSFAEFSQELDATV